MLGVLGAALLGGLILNVMPCVLPVLTLKAFHVVEHGKHSPAQRRKHGFAYTAGTVSLFLVIGALVVALKASGKRLGWGMQFQHPPFVAALTAIVFVFALNALGVFEILISTEGKDEDEDSVWGSVVNGWFAAIMSTPCSAPFVGSAVAFALLQTTTAVQTLLVFGAMGLGLAVPYLLLTLIPALGDRLPRPGAWMEQVKQLMGFALLGTTLWLFRTFQKQVTPEASNWFLFFLLAVAVAFWANHSFGGVRHTHRRRWIVRIFAVAGVVVAYRSMVSFERPAALAAVPASEAVKRGAPLDPVVKDGHIVWTLYDAGRVKAEHARNRPVFLDFTAEWCASCKANEKAFIESDTVRSAFDRTKVLPMKVDMTNESDELNALLDKFYKGLDRNGIPAYVVFYPDGTFDLLPTVITAEMVQTSLDKAAQKYPVDKYASL